MQESAIMLLAVLSVVWIALGVVVFSMETVDEKEESEEDTSSESKTYSHNLHSDKRKAFGEPVPDNPTCIDDYPDQLVEITESTVAKKMSGAVVDQEPLMVLCDATENNFGQADIISSYAYRDDFSFVNIDTGTDDVYVVPESFICNYDTIYKISPEDEHRLMRHMEQKIRSEFLTTQYSNTDVKVVSVERVKCGGSKIMEESTFDAIP